MLSWFIMILIFYVGVPLLLFLIRILHMHRKERHDQKIRIDKSYGAVVFCTGTFQCGCCLTFHSHEGGWESSGYLSQMHWGYLLALYAYLRYEEKPVYGWTT